MPHHQRVLGFYYLTVLIVRLLAASIDTLRFRAGVLLKLVYFSFQRVCRYRGILVLQSRFPLLLKEGWR
jgi:hypothetical protein